MEGGQAARWCQKLNEINFAGASNWQHATIEELSELYWYENDSNLGMYDRYGWPSRFHLSSSSDENNTNYWFYQMNHGFHLFHPEWAAQVSCRSVILP